MLKTELQTMDDCSKSTMVGELLGLLRILPKQRIDLVVRAIKAKAFKYQAATMGDLLSMSHSDGWFFGISSYGRWLFNYELLWLMVVQIWAATTDNSSEDDYLTMILYGRWLFNYEAQYEEAQDRIWRSTINMLEPVYENLCLSRLKRRNCWKNLKRWEVYKQRWE